MRNLLVILVALGVWAAWMGLAMIMIGAVGHTFDVLAFQYISYDQTFMLGVIFFLPTLVIGAIR